MKITKQNNGFDVIVDTEAASELNTAFNHNFFHLFGCWFKDGELHFSAAFQKVKDGLKKAFEERPYTHMADYEHLLLDNKWLIVFHYEEYGDGDDDIYMKLVNPNGTTVFEIVSEDASNFDLDQMILAWMTAQPVVEQAVLEANNNTIGKWIE